MSGFDLGGHVEFRGAYHFGRAAGRLALRVPGRIVNAGVGAVGHQFVIGRMKLDLVTPVAAGIESPQLGRVLVGEPAPCRHRRRTPMLPEARLVPVPPTPRHWPPPPRPAAGRARTGRRPRTAATGSTPRGSPMSFEPWPFLGDLGNQFTLTGPHRHGRTCSGHPRLLAVNRKKQTWMPATSAGMTGMGQIGG